MADNRELIAGITLRLAVAIIEHERADQSRVAKIVSNTFAILAGEEPPFPEHEPMGIFQTKEANNE